MSMPIDKQLWDAMRKLGVKWPRSSQLPTYPAAMTPTQKRQADKLYDAMSVGFVNSFGRWERSR